MTAPIVKVKLTEEQKRLVPDWEEQVAVFQQNCNKRAKDKSQRFRISLHEGGHTAQYRNQFGWNVKFHGPYVSYDRESNKLGFTLGAVSAIRTNNYEPLDWQRGMVSTAAFLLVEHFTGEPDDDFTIQNDLKGLRAELGENADTNKAVTYAELMLEDQLSGPTFLSQLEQACRDYEMDVYGTDEATTWGWREYRPELKGARHRVISPYCGCYGTLIEHGGVLTLLVEGEAWRPEDKLRGCPLEVVIAEPQREGVERVVREWNRAVSCEVLNGE
jgi:hypothetical protein